MHHSLHATSQAVHFMTSVASSAAVMLAKEDARVQQVPPETRQRLGDLLGRLRAFELPEAARPPAPFLSDVDSASPPLPTEPRDCALFDVLQALDAELKEDVAEERYVVKLLFAQQEGHRLVYPFTRHPQVAVSNLSWMLLNRFAVNSTAAADLLVEHTPELLTYVAEHGFTRTPRCFLFVALYKAARARQIMLSSGHIFQFLAMLRKDLGHLQALLPTMAPLDSAAGAAGADAGVVEAAAFSTKAANTASILRSFAPGLLFAMVQYREVIKALRDANVGPLLREYSELLQDLSCRVAVEKDPLLYFHSQRVTLARIVLLERDTDIDATAANLHSCVYHFTADFLRRALDGEATFYTSKPAEPPAATAAAAALPKDTPRPARAFLSVADTVSPVAALLRSKLSHQPLIGLDIVRLLGLCLQRRGHDPANVERTVLAATFALWHLSFSEEGRTALRAAPGILEQVSALASGSTAKKVKRNCDGILFQLKAKTQPIDAAPGAGPSTSTVSPKLKGHVMLSYCWTEQKFMMWLRGLLKSQGYGVWMDVDQMSGSTLEAMAKAIEDAVVVVVCLSGDYKDSAACRTEAEYAYQLKKPIVPIRVSSYVPDGWLGALLSGRTLVEFPGESNMDARMATYESLRDECVSHGLEVTAGDAARTAADAAQLAGHVERERALRDAVTKAERQAAQLEAEVLRLKNALAHATGVPVTAALQQLAAKFNDLESLMI